MERNVISNKDKLLRRIDNLGNNIQKEALQELYPFFYTRFTYSNNLPVNFISSSIASLGYDYYTLLKSPLNLDTFFTDDGFEYFKNFLNNSISRKMTRFNCIIEIKTADGVCFNACADGEISYSDEIGINLMVVVVTDDDENNTNIARISSLLHLRNYAYLQNAKNDRDGSSYRYFSPSSKGIESMPDEFKEGKKNLFDYIEKSDLTHIRNHINNRNFDENHNTCFVFKLFIAENNPFWIMSQNYINTQGENNISDSFILNITSQEQKSLQLKTQQLELKKSLKRTKVISEILQYVQSTNDHVDVLKTLMTKIADYLDISFVKIYFPTTITNNFSQYKYTTRTKSFSRKLVDMSSFIEQYGNIVSTLKKHGTAFYDKYRSSYGCNDEFANNFDFAHIIYSIKLENHPDGFISLSDIDPKRKWDNDALTVVSDISQVLTGLFSRFLTQQELFTTNEAFETVLNNIDSYVCVSTIDDDTIIFSNEKFRSNFNMQENGNHIWECIGMQEDDYRYLLSREYNNKLDKQRNYFEIFSPATQQWLDFTQTNIVWIDGKIVKLSTLNNISQKIEYEKLIEVQALNDHLTQLPNRRMLEHDFAELVDIAVKEDTFGYILFLDLDNFKNVNDELGHHYGDSLLHNIAKYLQELEASGIYAYRFGGDEFVLLLPPKCSDNIDLIVKQIYERFQQKWDLIDTSYFCTMSMGVARFPYDGTTLFELLKKVDMAMYNAKKEGKNKVLFYESKIGSDSIRNIELQRYLRESISNNFDGFSVFYQPIVNAKTKSIEGAEALLRWKCENLGNISPADFIPLAENIGLIVPLGDYVMAEACRQCKKMIDIGQPNFRVNINLSVNQILEPDFIEKAIKVINDCGVKYSNVNFEITESLAINDFKTARNILNELSSLGIAISLDDFGTGYSALNNIKELPLNVIKIDKSFIDDLSNNSTEVFVKMIIALSHELDIKVCAEGVETSLQYDRLLELKADIIQGYFFGKPIPANEFEQLLTML